MELWKRICEAMLVKMDNIRLFTCADNVHCYAKAPKWLQLKCAHQGKKVQSNCQICLSGHLETEKKKLKKTVVAECRLKVLQNAPFDLH